MNRQNGFLMTVAGILIIVVVGITSAFITMTNTGTHTALTANSSNYAYFLAKTGLEAGCYQLVQSISWCDGVTWSTTTTVAGQGEYRYLCTRNLATTTLTNAPLNATDTNISLTSIPAGMALFGAITIDSETIYYDGVNGTTLKNARRGANGTVAATHNANAIVTQAQYIVTSEGGSPSLTSSRGKVTLSQAASLGAASVYYAVGTDGTNGIILKYDGTSWSNVLSVPGLLFRGIDMSANNGQAVGTSGTNSLIYAFNGATWSYLATIGNTNLVSVSCNIPLYPGNCWESGNSLGTVRSLWYNNGRFFYEADRVTHPIAYVNCRNNQCLSGGYMYSYVFSYNSLSPRTNRTFHAGNIIAGDCGTVNSCYEIRSGGMLYYYNGSSFGSSVLINNKGLNGISCALNSTSCMVAGNNGLIYKCTLPGINCALQSTPGTMNLSDVYCISTTDCLAVGTGTVAYKYNGTSWAITSPVGGNYTLNGVSGSGGTSSSGSITFTVFHNQ